MARNHRCGTDQLNDTNLYKFMLIRKHGICMCRRTEDTFSILIEWKIIREKKIFYTQKPNALRENNRQTRKKCSQFIDHNNRSAWFSSPSACFTQHISRSQTRRKHSTYKIKNSHRTTKTINCHLFYFFFVIHFKLDLVHISVTFLCRLCCHSSNPK